MASTNTFRMRSRGDGNVGVRVAAETRLADLRLKLREALAQKKTRIAEFVEACKADRRAIREQVQEMRARSLRDLRDQIQAARGAAKLTRLTRLAEIRQVAGAPVDRARAASAVERQHQAELARLEREERSRRVEIRLAHERSLAAGALRSSLFGKLAPLFEREGRAVAQASGESRAEALLRFAERNPEKAHAVLEPTAHRKVEETKRAVVDAERSVRASGGDVRAGARPPTQSQRDRRSRRGRAAEQGAWPAPGEQRIGPVNVAPIASPPTAEALPPAAPPPAEDTAAPRSPGPATPKRTKATPKSAKPKAPKTKPAKKAAVPTVPNASPGPKTRDATKAPKPKGATERRKGELPRGGGGMPLADFMRERAELAAAKATRGKRSAPGKGGSTKLSATAHVPPAPSVPETTAPTTEEARAVPAGVGDVTKILAGRGWQVGAHAQVSDATIEAELAKHGHSAERAAAAIHDRLDVAVRGSLDAALRLGPPKKEPKGGARGKRAVPKKAASSEPATAPSVPPAPSASGATQSYAAWCELLSRAAGKHGRRVAFGSETHDAWSSGQDAEAFVLAQPETRLNPAMIVRDARGAVALDLHAPAANTNAPPAAPGATAKVPAVVASTIADTVQPFKVRASCGHIVVRKMRAATAGVPYSEDVVLNAPNGRACDACEAKAKQDFGAHAPKPAAKKDVKAPELRDTAEIAKRIRADIGEAVRTKALPKGKYSVQTDKYSMGSSINVVASALPFALLNPEAFHLEKGSSHVSFDRDRFRSRHTAEADSVVAKLNAIVDAYHWDNSDPMTDYHHERFGRDVKLDDEGEWKRINAEKVAAARAAATPGGAQP